MLGLILKDFIQLKRIMKAFAGVAVLYVIMAIIQKSDEILITLGIIAPTISAINSLAMDERSKWNEYALTLSFDRTKLVIGKYAMLTILSIGAAGITMIADTAFGGNIVEIGIGVLISSLIAISIIMPFLYKFGIEKGRYVLMTIALIPFVIYLFWDSVGQKFPVQKLDVMFDIIDKAPWLLVIAAIVLIIASMFASILICKKKEY